MSAKITILVVDDDEVTRKLLKEVLEKDRLCRPTRRPGEQAVRLSNMAVSDRVSDIRMVELDGMAVLREAKTVPGWR